MTVHVSDLERGRGFHGKVLGLEEEPPNPKIPRAVFKLPGTSTRLTMHVQGPTEGGREPGTVSGILFHSSDPVAVGAAIREHGGAVVNEPWTMQRAAVEILRVVVADPDGNEFILSSAL
ncbi:MAG: VOC family protein [Thermoplasmata archaeon]|nr:VOC family protein [Thermoplasmata archaeon]